MFAKFNFVSMPGGSEWILVLFAGALYFLPTIIAASRNKSNSGAIFALNLLLGWTLIGWVISIVWAVSADTVRQPTVIMNNNNPTVFQERKTDAPTPPHVVIESSAKPAISAQEKIDQKSLLLG